MQKSALDLKVDRRTPVPLYYQIKTQLVELISNGNLAAGQMLPSERELQERYQVSRATIRQALNELEQEGYLTRQHGVGTIIAQRKITPELLRLTSFSEDIQSRGLQPGAKTLELTKAAPPGRVAEALEISPQTPIWSIYRLRLADDEPIGLQRLFVPPWIELNENELVSLVSYYQLLEERHQIIPARANELIMARNATAQEAELLHIPVSLALLATERITYDGRDQAIEFVEFVYRADRYQYHVPLYRTDAGQVIGPHGASGK